MQDYPPFSNSVGRPKPSGEFSEFVRRKQEEWKRKFEEFYEAQCVAPKLRSMGSEQLCRFLEVIRPDLERYYLEDRDSQGTTRGTESVPKHVYPVENTFSALSIPMGGDLQAKLLDLGNGTRELSSKVDKILNVLESQRVTVLETQPIPADLLEEVRSSLRDLREAVQFRGNAETSAHGDSSVSPARGKVDPVATPSIVDHVETKGGNSPTSITPPPDLAVMTGGSADSPLTILQDYRRSNIGVEPSLRLGGLFFLAEQDSARNSVDMLPRIWELIYAECCRLDRKSGKSTMQDWWKRSGERALLGVQSESRPFEDAERAIISENDDEVSTAGYGVSIENTGGKSWLRRCAIVQGRIRMPSLFRHAPDMVTMRFVGEGWLGYLGGLLDLALETRDLSALKHFFQARLKVQQLFSYAIEPKFNDMHALLVIAEALHNQVWESYARLHQGAQNSFAQRMLSGPELGWKALSYLVSGCKRTWKLEIVFLKPGDLVTPEISRCKSLSFQGDEASRREGRRVRFSRGIGVQHSDGTVMHAAEVVLDSIEGFGAG